MEIYLHNIIENTRVEGPGLRTAVWLQGCSIRCRGCMIPDTWAFTKNRAFEVGQLVATIVANGSIEGLTILGGEPFDQSEALWELVRQVREKSSLSIMLFTGYTHEYLSAHNEHYAQICSCVDIFIEGPYVESLTDFSREWVGSSNQKIHFLTERYRHLENAVFKDENNHPIEIRLSKDGTICVNGMLPKEKLKEIVSNLSAL